MSGLLSSVSEKDTDSEKFPIERRWLSGRQAKEKGRLELFHPHEEVKISVGGGKVTIPEE